MLGAVFERFVDKTPVAVMVRGILERIGVRGRSIRSMIGWQSGNTQGSC